ncbi:MAG: cell division protein ZapA [Acidobacteria bacterium]|jgi:cell division protein ZapA|nr:cell division protein ZapA [Acidobacteriota bacterium]
MADKDNLVHVEIFGQDYAVRGGDDTGYVEKLAAFVDERMKEISRTSGAVDTLRIAVLAALNVADECFRLREELSDAEARSQIAGQAADQRVARLAEKLGTALGE